MSSTNIEPLESKKQQQSSPEPFDSAQQKPQAELAQPQTLPAQRGTSSQQQHDTGMSSPVCLEAIQALLSDKDKRFQVLAQHPKLLQMLQETVSAAEEMVLSNR